MFPGGRKGSERCGTALRIDETILSRHCDLMHCYLCGRAIPPELKRHRRRVRTGDRSSVSLRSGKVTARHTTYGQRVVCDRCAYFVDRQQVAEEVRKNLGVLGMLVLLLLFLFLLRR